MFYLYIKSLVLIKRKNTEGSYQGVWQEISDAFSVIQPKTTGRFFFKLHFYLARDTFPQQSYWEDFILVLCKE